eukprot:scaffold262225_cov21-Tisochrysis_lutea.AAC.1
MSHVLHGPARHIRHQLLHQSAGKLNIILQEWWAWDCAKKGSALLPPHVPCGSTPNCMAISSPVLNHQAALVKKWPRGSRWEDEDVGPKPYEGRLADCLLKDDAD